MSPEERAVFMEEATKADEAIKQKVNQPWPRITKMYLNQSKEYGWELGEEIGLDMEDIGSWCPGYEVEMLIEVQENGDSKIIACDGFMLDFDRPFTGKVYDPEG
jgi:hypothetical protein